MGNSGRSRSEITSTRRERPSTRLSLFLEWITCTPRIPRPCIAVPLAGYPAIEVAKPYLRESSTRACAIPPVRRRTTHLSEFNRRRMCHEHLFQRAQGDRRLGNLTRGKDGALVEVLPALKKKTLSFEVLSHLDSDLSRK
jgi:hypothetical protein